jgi:hypothetical protein
MGRDFPSFKNEISVPTPTAGFRIVGLVAQPPIGKEWTNFIRTAKEACKNIRKNFKM